MKALHLSTVGKYEGGEFQVEGTEAVKLKGGVWTFNGKDAHRSLTFSGERISLIWFCHTSWRDASEEQLTSLRSLGFGVPEEAPQEEERGAEKRNAGAASPDGRPVASAAFFEGIGSMAVVLKRLLANVVAH